MWLILCDLQVPKLKSIVRFLEGFLSVNFIFSSSWRYAVKHSLYFFLLLWLCHIRQCSVRCTLQFYNRQSRRTVSGPRCRAKNEIQQDLEIILAKLHYIFVLGRLQTHARVLFCSGRVSDDFVFQKSNGWKQTKCSRSWRDNDHCILMRIMMAE